MGRVSWRWVLSFVGTALLAMLLWLFGPLLPWLEDWAPRLAIVLVMLLVWLGANLLVSRRRRKREGALAAGVTALAGDGEDQAAEEVAALGERLSTAMALLRRARGTRGYIYEQPWYAIIGPPGAGKTTALLNAGLKFPLASEMGQGAVAGVGGTRLCDWWFTEEAVLIDTAGRYTTQDSNSAVDRAGWEGFLALLRRTRPRQPLNGVIVAISASDIAQAPAEERIAHARAIRRRIKELEEKLGVRLPVYALFTKADLLAGFTEFFEDLDREKRAQVWGATFPFEGLAADKGPGAAERFGVELRLLVQRLNDRMLSRLQAERSPDRRALIAGFPTQVASLEQPLTGFLSEAFGGSRMDPAPLLRGVYLASGTQEGTPIDRLAGAMARSFGIDQQRAPSLRPEAGRSYFLHRLLTGVIFGEAMLVREPPRERRRRLALRAAAFAAVLLAVLAGAALVLAEGRAGDRQVEAMARALAAYEATAKGLPLDPVVDSDLPRLVPLLDQARDLARWEEGSGPSLPGLSQGEKLETGAAAVYRHALNNALLPRMIWRLEAQMRGNLTQPDFLYEATRVYLMLGNEGPLDHALVREWMTLDWRNTYPGAFNAPLLASLSAHLERLLQGPLPSVPLDGALVAQARATFSRVSVAQRVYSRIKPSAEAQALAPWRPSDALGPAGQNVFVRPSGQPLTAGMPGFLTVAGFHRVLLPALSGAVKEVASESWVLGRNAEVNVGGTQLRQLERDVVALYAADYAAAWDAMLQDLDVVPLRSLTQASQDLYILASPQSPMKALLEAVAQQLTLSEAPPAQGGVAGAGADIAARAQAAGAAAAGEANARVSALLGGAGAAPAAPPGQEIDQRYQALRDLVAGGAGAPINQMLKLLNDLQQQLARMAAAPVGSAAPVVPAGNDPTLALRAEAQRQPQPVARWLLAMASSGAVLRGGGARQQVSAAYNSGGGPASLCPMAVNGRFPFVPGSVQEIPLDDFAKLFSPGGLIDGFFNTQLKPYADTSGPVWKPQASGGVPAPVSPADLAQFQRAAAIRDLFFGAGSATPGVRFDITPVQLDEGARQVTLDFDGTAVAYSHGPPRTTQITWPGPTRMQNVRLVFDPPPAGGTGVLSDSGPWAMFRMFNRGTLRQAGSPERFTLTFQLGERQVTFDIRAGSVNNPFAPGLLQEFRCPRVE
ncbi:type VI secretion system membrane subunit TssM [Roseomonas xinghualingensis]|uniref:type VI secretion system membrane subunit TssM n=1 Tax=Roseomonas xinghualingensis TaxID=2986475 RepID=UPI0021F12202|nr:type VI secretion system membrane subunit TssM [Roseomonas sp. SXEYE001]MCV4209659.1 type VI secretion system membrane subunit TssM [Roseomonas sp. SXEYE001]